MPSTLVQMLHGGCHVSKARAKGGGKTRWLLHAEPRLGDALQEGHVSTWYLVLVTLLGFIPSWVIVSAGWGHVHACMMQSQGCRLALQGSDAFEP